MSLIDKKHLWRNTYYVVVCVKYMGKSRQRWVDLKQVKNMRDCL
jgi:hypothetical protein